MTAGDAYDWGHHAAENHLKEAEEGGRAACVSPLVRKCKGKACREDERQRWDGNEEKEVGEIDAVGSDKENDQEDDSGNQLQTE